MSELLPENIRAALGKVSDWYIPENAPLDGFIYPESRPIKDLPQLFDIVQRMHDQCRRKTSEDEGGYEEFVVRLPEARRSYRGHKIESVEGAYYALRAMPTSVPPLSALGINEAVRKVLLSPTLNRGGLIMICGETGQGKSTTCAAAIKERMEQLGSFCLTVEDPPEMPLHGTHGKGRCIQTEVRAGNWAASMRGAMRCFPTVNGSILYVGETRDAETASEVLKIAMNGNLVFTTLHANSVPAGIKRMISLASSRLGGEEAADILSSVYRVGMHQILESMRPKPGETARKRLKAEFLISANHTTPVSNKIRKNEIASLGTDLQQQKNMLAQYGPKALLRLWD